MVRVLFKDVNKKFIFLGFDKKKGNFNKSFFSSCWCDQEKKTDGVIFFEQGNKKV